MEENGEWLASVIYYDDYARSIQIQTQQMGGEWDMMTNLYDFSGKVLTTCQEHQSQIEPVVVQQNFEYDHAGRLLKTYHKINQQETILLSNVRYNEVGQVKGKGLHKAVPLQDITFQYNIRGWLTHINDLSTIRQSQDSKLFAFQIHYEEADQYNGNIGKVEWKTVTDAVQRGYEFGYDKLNRLKYAKYLTADRRYNEEYSVFGITYDQNGNILTLNRNGLLKMDALEDPTQLNKQYGQIDNLDYSYNEPTRLRSNRLLNVTDQVGQTSGIAGDFQDGNNSSAPDYEYDKNGNLLTDTNKGIAEIKYNHLNLPEIIYFENENQILNTYDAAGIKLKSEIVENGVPLRTTYYKNGFIYEQKSTDPELQLSFFGTAEGRIVKKEERFVYEYHYKDHLGNLRVAFQAQEATPEQRQVLTMELDKAETEEQEFENVRVVRSSKKDKQGHYSAELTNANQPISKTLQVKKGDRIKASVFATHDPAIAETDPEKAITEAKKDVLLSLGSAAAGTLNTNPIDLKVDIPVNPEISPAQTMITKSPKVQLNLLDFVPVIRNLRALKKAKKAKILEPDTYFVPKGELVLELRDSTDSLIFEKREKLTISSAVSWEKLMSNLEIKEDGNLKVYIDNSSSDKVYFDNFEIERTEATIAVVVQENHYYPFGMNMKGIEELDLQSLDSKDEHRFQYNGKEKEESFGLNWTDYGWRNYDMQLGRWHGVDKLAEKYISQSTYHYAGNNPVINREIDGRWYDDKNEKKAVRLEEKIQKRQEKLLKNIAKEREKGNDEKVQDLQSRMVELSGSARDIKDMRGNTETEFRFESANRKSNKERDPNGSGLPVTTKTGENQVTMFMPNSNNLHEVRHGGQLARQEYTIDGVWGNPSAEYGALEEVSAYRAEYAYDGKFLYVPQINITQMTSEQTVQLINGELNITDVFGRKVKSIDEIDINLLKRMYDTQGINQQPIYNNNPPIWWNN